MPAELLRSHLSGLAVAAWAMYETLMPVGLGGGRAPGRARRCWVADELGTTTSALDDARRELLADPGDGGGPWLSRSSPKGAKRSVRHAVLRLPKDTRGIYAPVPAWTLDLIHAGRRRPGGAISPAAWRLYGLLVLARPSDRRADRPVTASVGWLGGLLHASPDTGRRRLRELETAGLAEVTERPGGRLAVRLITAPDQAEDAARYYATHGRRTAGNGPGDPSQLPALTPGRKRHSPLATSGTPQEAALQESPPLEASGPLAVGVLAAVPRDGGAADAERPTTSHPEHHGDEAGGGDERQADAADHHGEPGRADAGPVATPGSDRVLAAVGVAAAALPAELLAAMNQADRDRVVRAIETELTSRTVAELTARIRRRLAHWRGHDLRTIRRPVAVALTVIHRGYACPRPDCEDHRLPSGQDCAACDEIGTAINETRRRTALRATHSGDQPPAGRSTPPADLVPVSVDLSRSTRRAEPACPNALHRGAARRADGQCAACWAEQYG
ncbi:hypothetical protein [Spongiactinospora sp. 9N601]|uniref:hypothetical protein n=1 Tax=Spongiactinospora sp. 9N601 TaxID=3375149 RepID=UPI0037AA553E